MPKVNATLRERFERNVELIPFHACHEWTGCKRKGYGIMSVNWCCTYAHRIAYELYVAPITNKLCVLHHCDNRGCVNPTHLFLGTRTDNHKDMMKKGRHGTTRLTMDQVAAIRSDYAAGMGSHRVLGLKYGVSREHTRDIINYKYRRLS